MAFASAEDVATRLRRDLTEEETAAVEQVIEITEGLIAEVLGEDADWVEDLDPVPSYYRSLCISKAIDALANPEGLTSQSKTLGAYSESASYSEYAGDIALTDEERRRVLRNARGGSLRSVTLVSPYSGDDEEWPDLPL